jgi:hypothetical protein
MEGMWRSTAPSVSPRWATTGCTGSPVVDRFGIEAFGPGKCRRYQVPLRKITELTGVIFDDVLHAAGTLRGEHNVLPITAPAQIRSLRDGRPAPTVQEDPDI